MTDGVIWTGRGRHVGVTKPSPSFVASPDLDDQLLRHHRAAFGWALACCRWDPVAAEDVLQTAYLKLIDGRARYGGTADFQAFLFGVIRRTAHEERRRRMVRRVLSLGVEPSVPLAAQSDVVMTLPRGARDQVKATAVFDGPLPAPVVAGQTVGRLRIEAPGMTAVEVPLVTVGAARQLGAFARIMAAARHLIRG